MTAVQTSRDSLVIMLLAEPGHAALPPRSWTVQQYTGPMACRAWVTAELRPVSHLDPTSMSLPRKRGLCR